MKRVQRAYWDPPKKRRTDATKQEVELLSSLPRGEIAATETYQQALDKVSMLDRLMSMHKHRQ